MPDISITLKTKDFDLAVKRLKDRAPKAIARALNRASVSTRTIMVRRVAQDIGLKVGDVKKVFTEQSATPENLTARVIVRSKRIPLMAWNARQTRRGVTARLPGGAGRYPHAFLATMPTGHRGVFQRKRPSRLPIRELRGPSITHVFHKHREAGLEAGEASLLKNLSHELRFALTESAQRS